MRLLTIRHAVRVTCGLSLLLPAAVQEKVCAWPAPPESKSQQTTEPATPPASDEQPKPKKPPLTLAAMLPDAVAPRWPGHTQLTAVRRVRPLPATTWMDGPAGSDNQSDTDIDAIFVGGWSRCPVRELLPTCSDADLRSNRAQRHVFQTSILRTGPPRA